MTESDLTALQSMIESKEQARNIIDDLRDDDGITIEEDERLEFALPIERDDVPVIIEELSEYANG